MAAEPCAAPDTDWPLGAVTRRWLWAHAAGAAGRGGAGLRGGAQAPGAEEPWRREAGGAGAV